MPQQHRAIFKSLLSQLGSLHGVCVSQSGSSQATARPAQLSTFTKLLKDVVADSPSCTPAELTYIVMQQKVPLLVATWCSKIYTAWGCDARCFAALDPLLLLVRVLTERFTEKNIPAMPKAVAAAAAEQIKKSGLFQCLPAVLAAAAQHLEAFPSSDVQNFTTEFEETAFWPSSLTTSGHISSPAVTINSNLQDSAAAGATAANGRCSNSSNLNGCTASATGRNSSQPPAVQGTVASGPEQRLPPIPYLVLLRLMWLVEGLSILIPPEQLLRQVSPDMYLSIAQLSVAVIKDASACISRGASMAASGTSSCAATSSSSCAAGGTSSRTAARNQPQASLEDRWRVVLFSLIRSALGVADLLIDGFVQCYASSEPTTGSLATPAAAAAAACVKAVQQPHLVHCMLSLLTLTSANAALQLLWVAHQAAAAAQVPGSSSSSSFTGAAASSSGRRRRAKKSSMGLMPDFTDTVGGGECTAAALQFACSHHQQLPESFRQLLDVLGSNSLAAVWVACMLQGNAFWRKGAGMSSKPGPPTHVVVMSTVHAYSRVMHCMQQSRLLDSISQQQRRMHLLAPTALFAWAAAAFAPSTDAPGSAHDPAAYTPALSLAAEVVSKALQVHWGSVEDAKQLRQRTEGLADGAAFAAVLQSAVAAGTFQAAEIISPCVVGDVLEALEPVGSVLFDLWHKQRQAGRQGGTRCGGSSSTGGGASSGSTGGSSRGALQAEACTPFGHSAPKSLSEVEEALIHLLRCYLFLGSFSISSPVAALKHPRADAAAWFSASIAAWSQHTVKVCKLFESATRLGISAGEDLTPTESILDTLLTIVVRGAICLPEPTGTGAYLQGALAAQPGSRQQKQLLSLLFTCLKVAARLPVSQYLKAQELRVAVALAAAAAMHKLSAAAVAQEDADCNSSSNGSSGNGGPGGTGTGNSNSGSSVGCQTAGKGLLPWLALFGRCCLQWSQLLRSEQGIGVSPECGPPPTAGPNLLRCLNLRSTADIFLRPPSGMFWPWEDSPPNSLWSIMYTACLLCLKNPAVAAQMRAGGVNAGALLDLLRDTSDGVQEARRGSRGSRTGCSKRNDVGLLAQQLTRLGEGFAGIAIPSACNNPHCADLSAKTETAAVSGKGSLCGGCRVAHFCSKGCLTSHWKLHKPVCRALAAAAAAAAAAGQAGAAAGVAAWDAAGVAM